MSRRVSEKLVRIGAEALDPGAFQPYKRPKILCGGGWHWEGHSSHSTCPSCSSSYTTSDLMEKDRLERRKADALANARTVLRGLSRAGYRVLPHDLEDQEGSG